MQVVSTDIFIPPIVPDRTKSVHLKFEFDDNKSLNSDEFWDFCAQNDKLQIELVAKDEIKITFPRGFRYSQKSIEILMQLSKWQETYRTGEFFNHLVGYLLPNGLIFSPSFSWIEKERFDNLSDVQKEKLLHLCPDFVLELILSDEDLSETKYKIIEYLKNGAKLGWLIHAKTKQVFIYRTNQEVEILENPSKVSGEPLLTGFELDLTEIW